QTCCADSNTQVSLSPVVLLYGDCAADARKISAWVPVAYAKAAPFPPGGLVPVVIRSHRFVRTSNARRTSSVCILPYARMRLRRVSYASVRCQPIGLSGVWYCVHSWAPGSKIHVLPVPSHAMSWWVSGSYAIAAAKRFGVGLVSMCQRLASGS